MKNKLTFTEMQLFINKVVEGVMNYGFGYKQVLIDIYTNILYGDKFKDVDNIDIEELYNNGELNTPNLDINVQQYGEILKAIDREIDKEIKYKAAEKVLNKADKAVSNLIEKVIDIIDSLSEKADSVSVDDIIKISKALSNFTENVNARDFVSALVDNGVIPTKEDNVINYVEKK